MPETPIHVFIVEDDAMLLDMYKMKFEGEGFTVTTATNGRLGLDALQSKTPDILLLDVMMPEIDGFAVLTELKKNPQWKDIPVILLTNLGQDSDVKKGLALGANDYLIKANLTPAQVVEKVKTLLKK